MLCCQEDLRKALAFLTKEKEEEEEEA